MSTAIVWFRRDLRVTDHPALCAAATADAMLAVFVLDDRLLRGGAMASSRRAYLRHAVADLSVRIGALGGRLVIDRGDPETVVSGLARRVGAEVVHVTADHTPFARSRDNAVRAALRADGIALEQHPGVAVVSPGVVRTGSGGAYQVFTPFSRRWAEHEPGTPQDAPDRLPPVPVDAPTGVALSDVDVLQVPLREGWVEGGETAARDRLRRWLSGPVEHYADARDEMAEDGTSRLSADLHFGCLSPREVHSRLDRSRPGQAAFARQIIWRDFYLQVLAAWPHAATRAFREDLADLEWRDDPEGLAAWREGRTGFPLVDAGMRQLAATSWMHNRARMVTASFLCKDLLVDWRHGERHFLQHLVDGDVANNNGGWQWAAGTGTDAQPFVRIFNPVTQGRRFDPDGRYVRRWVPELAAVPDRHIHSPWTMTESQQRECGVIVGQDYPAPIVDHAAARRRALDWFQSARPTG